MEDDDFTVFLDKYIENLRFFWNDEKRRIDTLILIRDLINSYLKNRREWAVIDYQELLRRVCCVAVHYLLVLDTPLVDKSLVGERVLANGLYACYRDLVESYPEARAYADFVIATVSEYRGGEIGLETAIARIESVG